MENDKARRIVQLAQEACIREACAPKPGNVNRQHDFSDASLEDFLISAVAVGPAFENAAHAGVGQIVLQATETCSRLVRSNANLGIILLMAPLVKACMQAAENIDSGGLPGAEQTRQSLDDILGSLTIEDARLVYESIRSVNPGGLGRVSQQDIEEEPSVTLLEAMELASDRDSIASEYVTGFEITYSIGLPAVKNALALGSLFSDAIVQAFLTILAQVPDTLIARKNDRNTSLQVSQVAKQAMFHGGVHSYIGREKIAALDKGLRDEAHKLNPGTTADLTAAAVFLALLEAEA